ncbi:VOC family protein [Streptomyces sedi]|uniref:VOC family protein n=1 Tax=Streptomyces sedi TaxID=555059 RepID=A0A5C4V5A1_9ACTN|nr:VOC family protein [Streptomyces sedi]TNM31152.1 VOC family protein [Streptomyces sedi]
MNDAWPTHLAVGALRFARPTAGFDETLTFYRDDLGLPVLAEWRGKEGWDGAVLGLPGAPVHLEITHHPDSPPPPAPHPENQLVLYLRGPEARDAAAARLTARGHRPVAGPDDYWRARGAVLFTDPDGWRVVLAPWVFGVDPVPRPASRAVPRPASRAVSD